MAVRTACSKYVYFDSDGGSNVEAQLVPYGTAAARPGDPVRDGMTFAGWYRVTDAATGALADSPFDFDTPITESVTLKAGWLHTHEGVEFLPWGSDNSLPSSGSYYLTKDVTLPGSWTCGGTVDLCLNGHTVKVNDISSLNISGTLNLYDEEGGVITQKTDGVEDIVFILAGGTFNMYGGTITGSSNFMSAVMVYGNFNMYGGTITENHKGVTVGSGAAFTVSGLVNITGNERYDVYLQSGVIEVSGPLDADSRIGVSADRGVITSGLAGNGTAANFFSDSDTLAVSLNADGEAIIGEPGGSDTPGGKDEPGDNTGPGGKDEPGDNTGPGGKDEPGDNTGPGGKDEPGDNTGPGGNDSPSGENSGPGGNDSPGGNSGPGGNNDASGENNGPGGNNSGSGENNGPGGNNSGGNNSGPGGNNDASGENAGPGGGDDASGENNDGPSDEAAAAAGATEEPGSEGQPEDGETPTDEADTVRSAEEEDPEAEEDDTPSETGSVFSTGAGIAVGATVVVLAGAAAGFAIARKKKKPEDAESDG